MTQKELGYVELEWTCKRCGTKNPGMQRVCSGCGAPMAQDDNFELPDQQELITDKDKLAEAQKGPAIHCPYCHVLNPAGTKTCNQCGGDIEAGLARQAGQVLGAHQSSPVPGRPCPFCQQPVPVNAQRCPHCGGNLAATPALTPPAMPHKASPWPIVAGIAIMLLCCCVVASFLILSRRTSDVAASVAAVQWQLSIEILERQPVQKSAWEEDLPAQAQNVSCQDKYKERSDFAAPNATEVCGTPYTIDEGSGAGKVVQDCEYLVYASYCSFTVPDWVVIDTAITEGNDNQPRWPTLELQSGQREGERDERYQVTFDADGQTYTYTPADMAEFRRFELESQWILAVNTFGQITAIDEK